ncbi:uncharacterized protein BCR38DRAFT_406924 [Pseudomassariella vexata]|uniref:Uncharacterized protein n=1 Tax=Pseudomassariella vexata TaxID=1141098 RepID=A0A1Y2EBY6_9PEZI|nr:uncharacterized protein BCR38DRAFT_406924 [Pseudomassariella vexata]ORY69052.1 hypothetical protein BCR38DRAFT_406924 [Pseudomassariella vexata]
MTEREPDDSQPRKRIAVAYTTSAVGAVSSQEMQPRDGGGSFGYDVDTARAYQTRGTVSPLVSQYPADLPNGDVMYRQSTYPYPSKSYYSVQGWGGAYPDEGVDYAMNYPSYPQMSQEPVHMVPGYRYGSGSKAPVYVDPEASAYPYPSLVHRPASAVSSDLPNFSLSGMAASLPTPSDRLPNVNRTLTSSSAYRSDGLPGPNYSSNKATSDYGSVNSSFESPVSYAPTTTLPSNVPGRPSEAGSAYQTAADTSYGSSDHHHSYRSAHEPDSYVYGGDKIDSDRRGSQSSGGASVGSVLSNGQVYVPDPQHSHPHAPAGYAISAAASATEATTAAGGRSGGSVTSQTQHGDGHRHSAASLRGA